MATLKKIKEELKTVSVISTITNIYQEIAQLRMNEIRREVLKNREFLEEISRVYQVIKKSLTGKKIPLILKKKGGVAVFLSANEFFYGPLILEIWLKFDEFRKKNQLDLVVVGRIGKYLAESYKLGDKIFYFELDDEKPERENVKGIIEFVKDYEKVVVFHGKFETVLNQKPAITDISGGISFQEKIEEEKKYIFEPSPEAVLEFFETEIMTTLFNQTLLEHRLARYAARTTAMYQANENAKKIKKEFERNKRKLEWQTLDKKQMEAFSSFELWKKMRT